MLMQFTRAILNPQLQLPYEQTLNHEVEAKLGIFKDLLLKCLHRDPKQRPTIDEFILEFERLVNTSMHGYRGSVQAPSDATSAANSEVNMCGASCSIPFVDEAQPTVTTSASSMSATATGNKHSKHPAKKKTFKGVTTPKRSSDNNNSNNEELPVNTIPEFTPDDVRMAIRIQVGQRHAVERDCERRMGAWVCAELSAFLAASRAASKKGHLLAEERLTDPYMPICDSDTDKYRYLDAPQLNPYENIRKNLPSSLCAQVLKINDQSMQWPVSTSSSVQVQVGTTQLSSRPYIERSSEPLQHDAIPSDIAVPKHRQQNKQSSADPLAATSRTNVMRSGRSGSECFGSLQHPAKRNAPAPALRSESNHTATQLPNSGERKASRNLQAAGVSTSTAGQDENTQRSRASNSRRSPAHANMSQALSQVTEESLSHTYTTHTSGMPAQSDFPSSEPLEDNMQLLPNGKSSS